MSIHVWKPISELKVGGEGHLFATERRSWRMKSSTWAPTVFVVVSGGPHQLLWPLQSAPMRMRGVWARAEDTKTERSEIPSPSP